MFAGLELEPSTDNVCAVLTIAGQESTFSPDPPVPSLAKIARAETLRRADSLGRPNWP